MSHKEFIVKIRSGVYEWIDPVNEGDVLEAVNVDEEEVLVVRTPLYEYVYKMSDVLHWVIRDYDNENIFPFGDYEKEREDHWNA